MMQTPLELCGVHGVSTLPELLRLRAQLHPERTAFIFLEDGEREETRQSFAELHRDAERLALRLAAGGAAGSRALLLYRSGPEFVTAFVACLYAGVTAVPLSLRYARTGPEVLERIAGIARPALVLTDAANREGLRERLAGPEALASLPLLASDDPTLADPAASLPAPDPGSPAFLQFTSGSTGHPRGVTVTHRNILSNEALVYRAFGHDESTVVVSWLPHFHDMGLIGGILQPLYGGYPCVLMSPEAFVQRPVRWLAAIARYRATTSGGPSFAYRLCAERITEEERRELDLSSWQVAFNGAEPVHAETLDTFARAFEGCGFRRSAFFPCYGLAEATLFVSGGPPGEGATVRALSRDSLRSGVAADAARDDPAALRVTACGTLWPEQRVEIVDPDRGERLPEGRVGEIWVAGESVAAGYWDDPEATERTFGGRLDGGPERFLRTGDAGFVRDGRLYVTGRLKDVVILNGQNYHAEDIEETVVATGRLGVRCQCAAFALLRDGEEELAVVAEVDRREAREPGEVVAAVRARLNEVVGVRARVVALVARGGIPRTTSGKIRRAECRRQYLEGELRLLHEDVLRATAAPDGAEGPLDRAVLLALPRWERAAVLAVDLRAAAARLLHVEPDAVDPEAPLGRLGLDSLGSIQLAYAVERHLEVRVPLDACLGGASLRELAERAAVLAEGTAEAPGAGPEGSAASGDERDLSHGQQALYLTHRLAPASTAYHVSKALRLLGPLDVAALERALQRVLERHESLRSTFTQRDGRVVRRVVEEPSALPLEDATGWTAERLQRRVEEEAEAPFDLHDGPPVRVRLFRREEEHVLLFVAHHILVDFWSLVVVVDELGRLYRAELDGTRPTLEPAASYAEYVAWQDGLLASPRGEELWAYWRETLPREAEPLHLPTDFPRPPEQTYRGGEIRTRAGGPLTAGLRRAAAWQGCTLHTLLLTAYGVLLHRYSGQEEVRIGCPLFGRTREAFSRTVGYFVNPLPVRIRCEGIPHFAALARGVGEALGGAVAHQDLPFPLLVERLNPLRDPARTPLFQAMFVFPRAHLPGHGELSALAVEEPVARLRMGDVELESFPLARRAAQFEVKLTAAEAAGELHLALEYNADLWETESIQRLLVAYRVLLEGIASDAEAPVGTLPLLDAAVRDELLRMSRGPSRERAPTTLHGLFEAQVRATPDAPALLFGDAVLTFAGLDGRADRLARRLRERGVGPGARVAVHLRRSPEMVVAVLAALKAGAAYVPVDPASSAEVVRFILDDAAPAAVLTDAELAAGLPEDVPVFLVSPDGDGEPGDAEDLGVEVGPDDPAWVLYTSGSTGWPKGVVGCHRGSVNRCAWMWEAQPFRPGEVCFQNTGLGVVDSTWEIWAPLARGVPVRIVTDEVARDPGRLLRELGRHGITRICLVPSLLRVMLEEHPERIREAPRLVTWVASGEPLPADLVERFYRVVPHGVLYNQYGLTESSADITSFDTRALRGAPAPASVPVGRPISNVEAYILDRYGNPAPVGAAGELHLGGACLAREYLNLPERTARAFVATPLGEGAPILYRTGDLARYRADGTLEYLGRIDRQVKVRGFRVEPEGVELHLRRHPCVTQAVVSAFPHERDGNLLVAHVVCASGPPPPPAELRVFLGAVLPEHSIPSRFVFLDALPLTGSGKIDRKALPLPAAAPDAEGTQPRSEVEELVAGTFAALLGVPRPGIFDDFFDLGGHSLLAARAVSMLRDRLGVEIPLATFFRAPRPADLARVIEASRGTEEAVPPARIGRIPREGPLPLSPAQERLWFLDRMDPGMSTYNNFSAVRLEGELCREALRDALHALLERHEALRTTFLEHDGSPVTVVAPSPDLRLDFRDLSGLAAGEREGTALRQAGEEAARPFDLSEGPLFRALLLRLDERVHLLVVTVHHIVSDGWSVGVLTREVPEFYAASREGRPPALPRLPVQYPDYAAWQRAWLESGAVDAQMEYWRAALARSDAVLELPTDRPRPPVQSYRGAVERFVLPAGLRDRLRAVGQREGATLFMTLLAGLQCLLHRYTGQTGFVIGSPIAGRTRSELEGLIGLFANTLALRADLSGDPPFRELLGRVRESTLGAYQHQDLPFERVVEELAPERRLSHSPLFQVMLTLQNTPPEPIRLPGVEARPVELHNGTSKFDLTLLLEETGVEGLRGTLEYGSDLFDVATVRRLLEHYRVLLEGAAADAGARVRELPLLGPDERRQVLEAWNRTRTPFPALRVDQLVEAQARRTPQAVAVRGEEGEYLTYRELEEKAGRLAHRLHSLGVGPEVRVALCLERSPDMVVALLGVLRAGGVYVPLDPGHPAERIAYILQDARVSLLLTHTHLLPRLPAFGVPILALDASPATEAPMEVRAAADPGPEALAYVLYTSGSTGRPKGVMVPHRAVVNFLVSLRERPGLAEEDVLLAVTTLSFDIAALEIFLPLTVGARVVVADRETAADGARLAAALRESGATVMQATPATWRMLLHAGWSGDPRLRALCGGEALPPDLAAALRERTREVWNLYGPTETTIWSTLEPVEEAQPGMGGALPIGRPIANTRVYVLDERLEPAPVGVPGELFIGGEGVSRGYWERPELTAERFVPDPFSPDPGARLYRTGDRARWTADGKTEFLGRTDFQVKVRGYRIEPGEIEAVLVVHPGVREALVVVRQDAPGDARLVAYVVPAAEARAPSPCELREHLRGRLPEYMLPSAFVVLDALPLTPNGKVDRRALPDPELEPEGAFVAPRTPTEEVLAGIFAELLRREQIGAHDNFFHLGGHSLLAMQVVARVRHALGAEIPVRTLFERPTLTELALAVEAASGDGWLPAIPLAPRDRAFPLAPAQERLWFLDQMDPGNDLAYTLAGAVRLEGPLQVSALERALGRILERHEVLRTRFEVWEGRPVQVVESAVAFPLPVEDLAGDPAGGDREAAVLEWAAREARHPFDLAAGPLIRARLLRVSPRDHVLLVTVHHLVADGWSLEVLMRDLAELYAASLEGRPPRLPGLPVQYADYAVWHAEWLRGRVEPQLAYWRRELEGSDPVLELPTDRPRPPIQAHRGAVERFVLPAGLRDSLDDLGRRAGATLFMVLLAGLQSVFHRYTGQTDFVIGSPVANRTRPEVEGLIGMFFNTLALRARLEGDPTFTGLLDRVRTTLLGAFQHQDLPFERLVEELAPERRLSHSPIFQVVCAFQDAPGEGIQLPGCEATSLPVHNGTSKFDLAFFLENAAEGIRGVVEYDTDLFDAGTVRRLVGHLCTLLEGAAADPRLPVGSLPLLTREEMERLRAEWSRTEAEYPRGTCLHTLFEAQAAGTPDAVALLFAGREVTYRELDARASRLAGRLRSMGVGPGEVAGVCLDRSPALTVAVLATLKAGGAYVPLDPTYPDARLRYILSDSGTRVLLTDAAGAARLGAEVPCVLCRDAEWEAGGEPAEPCPGGVDAEDVACVIYTSGSTGQPKGVALPHRAVVNRLAWMWREFPFAPGEVLAAKTSIGFVDAVWETFGPLLRGTPTVVLPSESTRDPVELLEHAARWRVTRLTVVPSVLKRFIEEHPRCLPLTTSLRMVVTSGEALERDTAAAWLERFPGVRLVNLYGCTEAGADSTCLEVRDAAGPWALVSIGRSIANTALLVLDRYGNPAPVGIPGELCIAGEGLARGYHGRPDLTAERFVPSPVAALPGRIYRTGDAARYAEDLSVSYLGRIDQQVKVRGIRVEPVEIEEALRRHPAVREAVAAVRPGPAGEPWIVAYLSLRGGVVPGDEELRAAVGEWLPESVIPGAFVVLDELPLTPSGKVDRRALPDVSRGTADPAALRVAPRTPTESRIAEVWRDLLGVESVGVHDSFFALGGHSLLATRLLLRIRSLFGLKLTLKDFFAAPTVAGLAARVEGSRAGEDRILALLESVEQASEEEVERLLALDSPPQGGL